MRKDGNLLTDDSSQEKRGNEMDDRLETLQTIDAAIARLESAKSLLSAGYDSTALKMLCFASEQIEVTSLNVTRLINKEVQNAG